MDKLTPSERLRQVRGSAEAISEFQRAARAEAAENRSRANLRAREEREAAAELARYITHVLLERREPADIDIAFYRGLLIKPRVIGRGWVMHEVNTTYIDTNSRSYSESIVQHGRALMTDGRIAYYLGNRPTGLVAKDEDSVFGSVIVDLNRRYLPYFRDMPKVVTHAQEAARWIGVPHLDADEQDLQLYLGAQKINSQLLGFGLEKNIS